MKNILLASLLFSLLSCQSEPEVTCSFDKQNNRTFSGTAYLCQSDGVIQQYPGRAEVTVDSLFKIILSYGPEYTGIYSIWLTPVCQIEEGIAVIHLHTLNLNLDVGTVTNRRFLNLRLQSFSCDEEARFEGNW